MKTYTAILATALFFTSCFTSRQAPVQTKQTFTFAYNPRETNKPGSANMLVAFVRPYYATGFSSGNGELFKRFREGMGHDIEQIIIAKGFTMKGPYDGYDEMIFEDKKTVDMVIQIEIAPSFTAQDGGWRSQYDILTKSYTYYFSGTISLVGKINITGVEPLTNQKIWTKSVEIPNVENIAIKTQYAYHEKSSADLFNDAQVYNAIGSALVSQYAGIMDKISAHFNIEEFNSLKPQIKELKSKKGY